MSNYSVFKFREFLNHTFMHQKSQLFIMKQETIVNESKFTKKTVVLFLLTIGVTAFTIRFFLIPSTPLSGDSTNYFVYAAHTALHGRFSDIYYLTNNGWPLLLSLIFGLTSLDNPTFLMSIQKISSMFFSVITIIPLYFLCRNFFGKSSSIFGTALFVFEPHIITNSTLGITEPLFLFLGISSLALFFNNNIKFTYISFTMVGLFTLIRFEGLLFFLVLSIIFLIKNRQRPKNLIQYPLILLLFVLILLPIAILNIETHDRDSFLDELFAVSGYSYTHFVQGEPEIGDPIYGDSNGFNMQKFLTLASTSIIKFTGLLLIPISIIFASVGFALIIKNRKNIKLDHKKITIIAISVVMLLPAVYTYGRGSEDVRFLFMLYPIIILISTFTIEKLKNERENMVLIIIIAIMVSGSIIYLETKNVDLEYENDVFTITKVLASKTNLINGDSADIRYRTSVGIIQSWPDLPPPTVGESHIKRSINIIPMTDEKTIIEFIEKHKQKGLSHIAVDGNEEQPEFLKEIFYNEKDYPYLNKVYDSNEFGIKYHVKFFEIDFGRLNEI